MNTPDAEHTDEIKPDSPSSKSAEVGGAVSDQVLQGRTEHLSHDMTTGEEDFDPADAEALEAFVVAAAQFSGPLPPPEILRAYDEVVNDGAERIFTQWEQETKHRHGLESQMATAYISGTTRAQWMAFIVILVIGAGGLIVVALGYALAGFAAFFLALAAVAASFFRKTGQVDSDGLKPADEDLERN